MNNIQDIHELALILMNSFNLDIEHAIFIHDNGCLFLDPLNKLFLVVLLDGHPFCSEFFIFCQIF